MKARWGKSSTTWIEDETYRDCVPFTCDCNHTRSRNLEFAIVRSAIEAGLPKVGVTGVGTDAAT